MKERIKFLVATICIASVIGCFIVNKTSNETISDLTQDNIDALAAGEGSNSNVTCFYSGSIDCFGHKVKYRYEGYSLE